MGKKNEKNIKKGIVYIIMVVIFLLGFFSGILFENLDQTDKPLFSQVRENGYEYINPLVDFETIEYATTKDITKLRNALFEYVDTKISEDGDINRISIYYKDLNSGAWIGVNEKEQFTPASLLKVPMMIVCYKIAESNPSFLEQTVVYKRTTNYEMNIPSEVQLTEGKTYTLDQLIDQLIKYSDNTVLEYVESFISKEDSDLIYSDLAIPNPRDLTTQDSFRVKDYAAFFRVLYNASYLNKEMSSKALRLLAETQIANELREGIPSDIKIAKKFGVKQIQGSNGEQLEQLHDCGIVYHPNKPYLFCIMTAGKKQILLQNVIKDITKTIFNSVNSKNFGI